MVSFPSLNAVSLPYLAELGLYGGMMNKPQTAKSPVQSTGLSTYLEPGSSLLSHGETPHYHRRYGVSLLSSAWGQVGPPR